MTTSIEIDQDACYGSGECVQLARHAFRINQDGVAETLDGATDLSEDEIQEIVAACPSGAISTAGETSA